MISEVSAMLMQFRVKNYRSIGDEVIIDLVAGGGRELPDFPIEIKKGVKLLPVISIYGSNAAGKSNIIEAMFHMFRNITYSHRYDKREDMLTVPFMYDEKLRSEPTEFEIFIALDGVEYQYGFTSTLREVHEEWLYKRTLSAKKDTISKLIFERKGDEIKLSDDYRKFKSLMDIVGEQNLFLSFLGAQKSKTAKAFVDMRSWVGGIFNIYTDWRNFDAWAKIYKDDSYLKESFVSFIREFDPCIEGIEIEDDDEINKDGETGYRVLTRHNGKPYPMIFESEGTRRLFSLYAVIHTCLKEWTSLFVCDELDAHLHPLVLRRIVGMFHDKEVNKMGSQLIFSSHNLIVLDNKELRRDEIVFIEKDERGFTTAYALDSFKTSEEAVRSDLNYGKHYLAGRFGAIPYANISEDI